MKIISKIIDLKDNSNYEQLKECANAIKNGELVIFPTETVYGIGANGLDETAISKIFIAKGRKTDNPLILHISNMNMVNDIATNISDVEYKLMNAFWPGPLTIILNKKECVPNIATGNLNTVGVRMPSNEIARKLIEYSNVPIAAPSANISGRPSGTTIEDIIDELGEKVAYIINGGESKIGVESTVIRVIDNKIHILRPGFITKNDLEEISEVVIDKHVLENITENDIVMSPGMKYKHYAPTTKCVLVYSKDNDKLIDKINELVLKYGNALVICNNNNINKFSSAISYGNTKEEISHNIFRILRSVDNKFVDIVIIEGVDKEGLGLAIMNRLLRACSYNYIEI